MPDNTFNNITNMFKKKKPVHTQIPLFDPLNNQQYWNPEPVAPRTHAPMQMPGPRNTPDMARRTMQARFAQNGPVDNLPYRPGQDGVREALISRFQGRRDGNGSWAGEAARNGTGRDRPGFFERVGNFMGPQADAAPEAPIDPNADLMAQIMAIAGKPDIPGQWISPYSQDYLNQLGGRLTGAGEQASAGFGAANQELIDMYNASGAATNQISDTNQAGLGANLANLGLNYGDMEMSQQWDADQAQMNQVAGQNLATDQSFNTKLGGMFQQLGSHYGDMAREGILTPKQWVGPQSGISDGERMQVDMLKEQMNRNLDNMDYESALQMEQEMMNELNGSSTQEMEHINPLFSQTLGGIQDPAVKEATLSAYNMSGGDIPKALQLLSERMATPGPGLRRDPGNDIFGRISKFASPLNSGNQAKARQDAIDQQVLQILMGISPTITGVPTLRTNTDTSNRSQSSGSTIRT